MATKKTEEVKKETAAAVDSATKTKAAAAKKPAAKKPAAKKAPAKTAEKKVVTKIQFGGKEVDVEEIAALCKADYKEKTNGHVRSLSIYVKPEESAAYYVVNDKFSDKVEL
jgi:hypothetical protein